MKEDMRFVSHLCHQSARIWRIRIKESVCLAKPKKLSTVHTYPGPRDVHGRFNIVQNSPPVPQAVKVISPVSVCTSPVYEAGRTHHGHGNEPVQRCACKLLHGCATLRMQRAADPLRSTSTGFAGYIIINYTLSGGIYTVEYRKLARDRHYGRLTLITLDTYVSGHTGY
jgi:hypothetical protein